MRAMNLDVSRRRARETETPANPPVLEDHPPQDGL
jgi:hypothetical protein